MTVTTTYFSYLDSQFCCHLIIGYAINQSIDQGLIKCLSQIFGPDYSHYFP